VCELLYYTYWVVLFSCVSVCMWDPDPQQSLLFSPVTCRVDCSLAVHCHLHVMRIHFVLLEMQTSNWTMWCLCFHAFSRVENVYCACAISILEPDLNVRVNTSGYRTLHGVFSPLDRDGHCVVLLMPFIVCLENYCIYAILLCVVHHRDLCLEVPTLFWNICHRLVYF
jgi:hypothetical protein